MLDPGLQEELKRISRTAAIAHCALLLQPVMLLAVAAALKQTGVLGEYEHPVGILSKIFLLVSALFFVGAAYYRKISLSPHKLSESLAENFDASLGAGGIDAAIIKLYYSRTQIIPAMLAVGPSSIFGLAIFLLSREMGHLVALAGASVGYMVLAFPGHEKLEAAVAEMITRGEAPESEYSQ